MAAPSDPDRRGRRGRVLYASHLAGWIEETTDGMAFRYADEWLASENPQLVSLTLPLRAEPYTAKGLHPFFENLLPEGWLLNIAVGKLKLARADGFGLLLALCRDCVGAVSVEPWPAPEATDDG